jgi:hypothetical protein
MSYSRKEQMDNLDREERREERKKVRFETNNSQPEPSKPPDSGLYMLDKIKKLSPYLQKLLKELSIKFAKLKCTTSNIDQRLYVIDQHRIQGALPKHMHSQQKFVNNLIDMDTKNNMILHLLQIETTKLNEIKMDIDAKINDMYPELESFLAEGSTYHNHIEELKPLLNFFVDDEYHTMQLKMFRDKAKKDEKQQKFLAKKEQEDEPVEVSKKDINKLLKEIQNLKIQQKKLLTKNVQGKETKKKAALPKDKKQGEKKVQNKSTKGSNTNGKKKSTSIKRRC